MPLNNPKWIRVLGEFYEAAYTDLISESGAMFTETTPIASLQRLTHPPPRLYSITTQSPYEIIVRENGQRAHEWLQKSGFEQSTQSKEFWSFKATDLELLAYTTRRFLEEFPYLDSKYTLSDLDRRTIELITSGLEIFYIIINEHQLWYLEPNKSF